MEEILSCIPQRPPFLFVDKIINRESNSIHTQKNVKGDEEFFKGHFPENPIMPGVLLQEAAFQTGALLLSSGGKKGIGLVTRVDDVKFRELVRPGDLLDIFVDHVDTIGPAFLFKAKIKVKDKTVASLNFSCVLKES
jgi:3-hydroxyacyl-[acyl-carrier-protein] dehydratase